MATPDLSLDNSFDLQQASDWTRRYREQHPIGVKGHHFSRATLEAILAQPGCAGIRLYYGRDENNQRRLVLVGTDVNDHDLLAPDAAATSTRSSLPEPEPAAAITAMPVGEASSGMAMLDSGTPCPPCCSIGNKLNS